ncbi:MAG: esterase [marine bacterium B5-7]|nr:MAG: esterase [marine bacterium B5-7]
MINIICFGDSITEGAEFTLNDRWTSLLQIKLDTVKPETFSVHNKGIGGNTTAQGLDRIETDVLSLLPGIVFIQFGFNDANVKDFSIEPRVGLVEFEKNLKEFHRIVKAHKSVPVFVLNHTIGEVDGEQGNGKSYNDNYAPYNKAIQTIAKEVKAVLIDIPMQMLERGIKTEDFVSDDQIHLSLAANNDYAEFIYAGLNKIKP